MMASLGLVALSLALMLAMLAAAGFAARRFRLHPEVSRKSIHVGLGLYCLSFPFLFDRAWPVLLLCGAAIAVLLAVRASRGQLGTGLHAVARDSDGEVLFAAAVGLLFVLGHRQPVTYMLPLAILTLSDAAAALVGVRYGRSPLPLGDPGKSVEGSAMFLLTAWIVAMSLLLAMSAVPRSGVILLGGLMAGYGALVEGTSWRGWDNLFLPLALHAVLARHLGAPPALLLEGAALSLAGWAALVAAAPWLRLDGRAAAFAAAVLATIGLASSPLNMALPIAAFACHLATRPDDAEGDLQMGLVTVLLALAWFLVSHITGLPTVAAFNASFAALGVGLLAVRGRIAAALLAAPALAALVVARALLPGAVTPTDAATLLRFGTALAAVALLAAWAGRRRGPADCNGVGWAAVLAGATVLPLP